MNRILSFCFFSLLFTHHLLLSSNTNNNTETTEVNDSDTVRVSSFEQLPVIYPDDPVVAMLDSMYFYYFFADNKEKVKSVDYSLLEEAPAFSDSIYFERISMLNEQTPFELRYNTTVASYINLYTNKKRKLSSKILGLSEMYFPMFEEILDKYDMPLELKYLAVIESALNPTARSRMGATGLWQFMYNTGKMYNLNVTSYIDERMDPYLSTEAACKYLKFLHGMYDDWNLALAAYNAGPGNVNKAIRRAGGGKKGYWEVRPYLPRETQSYVPAFIAVNYMMNFAEEHHIYPEPAPIHFFDFDTVVVNQAVSFDQISEVTCVDKETLKYLNPVYKRGFIPSSKEGRILYLPKDYVGIFLMNEQYVYEYREDDFNEKAQQAKVEEDMKIHYVRSGEYLGLIASRYGCSVKDIMEWNNLRSSNLNIGQKLVVHPKSTTNHANKSDNKNKTEPKTVNQGEYTYHTVKSGDSLWEIARKYNGVTVKDLEQLNKGIDFKRLKPGQKIKVGNAG
jgi:membrane-bound lytic murein transglycosylase D